MKIVFLVQLFNPNFHFYYNTFYYIETHDIEAWFLLFTEIPNSLDFMKIQSKHYKIKIGMFIHFQLIKYAKRRTPMHISTIKEATFLGPAVWLIKCYIYDTEGCVLDDSGKIENVEPVKCCDIRTAIQMNYYG